MNHLIEILLIAATGLCFGSFITVAAYRLPLGQEIVRTPSHCTSCNRKLGVLDLFPVFSWLFSGGRCRHCGVAVSVRYPLTEIATASMFLLIYTRYGISPMSLILMGSGLPTIMCVSAMRGRWWVASWRA